MIVILSKNYVNWNLCPGDTVTVEYNDSGGRRREAIKVAEFTKHVVYDTVYLYCFIEDDGTMVPGISVFLGQNKNLPKELKTALEVTDLSTSQLRNFLSTVDYEYKMENA